MPTVDLTPRLVRESRPGDKDTILFDRSLPVFGRMPLDRIGPEDVAARSTPARPNGPRPSPLFGCWRSPGCRRGEVLSLRWRDIGDDAINLPDYKTGSRSVPLGEAARAHIKKLPGVRSADAFVFSEIRRRLGPGQPCRLLADGVHGCRAR